MIDMHCHIIPGIDDGADSMQCSIEMAKMAYEDGVKKIIATPHFYRNHFENSFNRIQWGTEILNEQLKKLGIDLEIFPGQEIFLDSHLLQLYRQEIIKPLNKKNYMLLETDFKQFPKHSIDIIYELKILGIRTIIAHPERYLYVQESFENLNAFIEEGCLFQINTGSIMGLYGKETKNTAKLLMKKGLCDFVASDAHGVGRRNPKLKECYNYIKRSYGDLYNSILENAEALVEGQEIEVEHEVVKGRRKGFFQMFK